MKKAVSGLLIMICFLWGMPLDSSYAAVGDTTHTFVVIGDTDRDGNISVMDATLIQYHIIRARGITEADDPEVPLNDVQLLIADVDEDGLLTIADATAIQRYCLDIETFGTIGKIFEYPEPVTEPTTEPVTEPATEPLTEAATEQVTELVTEPATEFVTEPATEFVTEPATEFVTEPATEFVTEPATVFVTEPATEFVTEPATEPLYPTSITFNKNEIVLTKGQTYRLNNTIEPSDVEYNTVLWYSDDPDVAQVDSETGVIEAISKGRSTVIAETENGLSAECIVWVAQTDEEDIDEFSGENINYTTNYYDINYEITVNPTITTDTNNFLASTGDTSDRSGDIATLLKKTGCCVLGSGEFYIKGVKMPDDTMIRGQGNSTHVYWIDEEDSPNYIFKLGSRCSIADMWISQYKNSAIVVQSEVRDFSAIEFSGYFYSEDENSKSAPFSSTLSNLYITDIEGSGIKLYRTGTNILAHISAVNCFILRCDCGILDDVISEFHQFTNISCNRCYYGVICRGGNNTFNNCNFSANYVGVFLDNSNGQSYNNGHGIFSACVIDHSKPNNTGTALLCDGITAGMRFVGCTIAYGNITIKNSIGIRFYDCGMSVMDLQIQNSQGTLFSNMSFRKKSTISITETDSVNTRYINCYYSDGTEFTRQ